MRKIGIAILLALVFMGGCKTSKKSQKTENETTVETDSTAFKETAETSTPQILENENVDETVSLVQEIDETPEARAFPQGVLMAHINTIEILEAMPENAKAEKELIAYRDELENQIKSLYEEYQKKVEDYTAEKEKMSELMRTTKEKEIYDLQNRIQLFQENAEKELENKQVELFKPIRDKIQRAIDAVTREQGFVYILDKSTGVIAYIGDDAVDATPFVKRKLGLK